MDKDFFSSHFCFIGARSGEVRKAVAERLGVDDADKKEEQANVQTNDFKR